MSKKTDREMQFKENGFSKIKQNQNGEKKNRNKKCYYCGNDFKNDMNFLK